MSEFHIDKNVAEEVAARLRAAGQVALTARDLELQTASDDEHLLYATEAGRILVTHNESEFILLHNAWLRWFRAEGIQDKHTGIIIVPQGRKYALDWNPPRIAEELLAVAASRGTLANELLVRRADGWRHQIDDRWTSW